MMFYLQYRPQRISELDLTEVREGLARLLSSVRVPHAFLFAGPRGTGKTSAARIMAKAVNCQKRKSFEPCNRCSLCKKITAGTALDLIEIDAASNRGIDDVRDLREKIKLSPLEAKYKVYIIDECFRYQDRVTMSDGRKEKIGKLVNQRISEKVLSFNPKAERIESKRIVNWLKKKPEKPVVKVTLDNNTCFVCTFDHKIFIPGGKIKALNLKPGHKVYVNERTLTERQKEILFGCLLGDTSSSLTSGGIKGRMKFIQAFKQKEYLYYKYDLFKSITRTPPIKQYIEKSFSKQGVFQFSTRSLTQIGDIYRGLYRGGVKKPGEDYFKLLTSRSLAFWYMDDGCLHKSNLSYKIKSGEIKKCVSYCSSLSTHGFGRKELELAVRWFQKKWHIQPKILDDAGRGLKLVFSASDTKRLHSLIKESIHPSMEHKLLPEYRGCFQRVENGNSLNIYPARVKTVKLVDAPPYVFNIEVEDNHNYFINNTLVENCHMLTAEAFNALLKTLEEPPAHAIFILCTTQPEKLPETITSRCLRFNFRKGKIEEIVHCLEKVVKGENLKVKEGVLEEIAKDVDGSFRDAQKILEQLSLSKKKITVEMVEEEIGKSSEYRPEVLLRLLAEKNTQAAIKEINRAVEGGVNLKSYTEGLLEILRDCLLQSIGCSLPDRGYPCQVSCQFNQLQAVRLIELFTRAGRELKTTLIPQLPLELAIVEWCSID